MAKTIPQLTDATTVNAADELIIQQGGITKRATATELFNGSATVTSTGSTTGRTLKDRFSDVVSVKDFGAVGDGVADDTTAIQAAINSVAAGQKVGLRFPPGTYVINGALSVNGRFVSFAWEYPCSFVGTGTVNGYSLATTNWQFASRIQNKLFVGTKTDANDGAMWSNGSSAFSQDWVETEVSATSSIAQMVSISDTGYQAILGASRTSDNPLANSQGTMGVAGIVVADKVPSPGNLASAYGLYVEARRKGNAGFCHGFEVDVISRTGSVSGSTAITTPLLRPNSVANAFALIGGWFSNSRPDITDGGDASVGIGLINNAGTRTATQGRYRVGILFDQNAILGADLTNIASATNIGNAIALGTGHAIGWWGATATTAPTDYVTGGEGTLYFYNSRGSTFATTNLSTTNPNVNYLMAFGADTNSAPALSAAGADSVCDVRLSPKGTAGAVTAFGDNLTTLGKSAVRWSQIWSANGTIQTSDQTEKTDVTESVLGLEFVKQLNPVSYKFIVGGNQIVETDPTTGIPTKIEPVAGQRTHFGLIAQEVKAVIPEGVDFGGWIKTDMSDPQSAEGLRYDQFIAPIIKAIQQIDSRVTALETA